MNNKKYFKINITYLGIYPTVPVYIKYVFFIRHILSVRYQ